MVRISEWRFSWQSRQQVLQAKPTTLGMYVLATFALLAWSGTNPREMLTWWLEVAPVLVALPLLMLSYKRFTFTPLVYFLIFIAFALMIIGGHYTYAHVPIGEWAKGWFGFERNHYDRVGHFMQGFVPALIARELLLRTSTAQSAANGCLLLSC